MKRALTYFIVGLHLFFFCSFVFGHYLPKKRQRMVVHAARLQTPITQAKPKTMPVSAKSASSTPKAAKPAPAPKKKPPTPSAKNPKTAKKEPKKEKKNLAVSKKLVEELQESIAKIDEKPDNFKSGNVKTKPQVKQTPLVLNSLERDPSAHSFARQISSNEIKELLVLELKNSLHLPDFGEVTMRLVLRTDGSVAEVKVLKSASKKNSDYLERELPKHSFSFITDFGLKDKERNFVITFCNEL